MHLKFVDNIVDIWMILAHQMMHKGVKLLMVYLSIT